MRLLLVLLLVLLLPLLVLLFLLLLLLLILGLRRCGVGVAEGALVTRGAASALPAAGGNDANGSDHSRGMVGAKLRNMADRPSRGDAQPDPCVVSEARPALGRGPRDSGLGYSSVANSDSDGPASVASAALRGESALVVCACGAAQGVYAGQRVGEAAHPGPAMHCTMRRSRSAPLSTHAAFWTLPLDANVNAESPKRYERAVRAFIAFVRDDGDRI